MALELEVHLLFNPDIASHASALESVKRCLDRHRFRANLISSTSVERTRPALYVVINGSPRLFPGPFDDLFVTSFLDCMFKCHFDEMKNIQNKEIIAAGIEKSAASISMQPSNVKVDFSTLSGVRADRTDRV